MAAARRTSARAVPDLADRALVAAGGGGAGTFAAGGVGGSGGDPGQDGANGAAARAVAARRFPRGGAGGNGSPPTDATLHGEDGSLGFGGAGGGGVNSNGGGGGGGGGVFGGGGAGAVADGFGVMRRAAAGARASSLILDDRTPASTRTTAAMAVSSLRTSWVIPRCLLAPLTVERSSAAASSFAPGTRFDVTIELRRSDDQPRNLGLPGCGSAVTMSCSSTNAAASSTRVGPAR